MDASESASDGVLLTCAWLSALSGSTRVGARWAPTGVLGAGCARVPAKSGKALEYMNSRRGCGAAACAPASPQGGLRRTFPGGCRCFGSCPALWSCGPCLLTSDVRMHGERGRIQKCPRVGVAARAGSFSSTNRQERKRPAQSLKHGRRSGGSVGEPATAPGAPGPRSRAVPVLSGVPSLFCVRDCGAAPVPPSRRLTS